MAGIVFILCALTSLLVSVLLFRSFLASRVRLLFWSGLCFAGLALNNILLYVDTNVVPAVDLSIVRTLPAIIGVCCLLYGLIMEALQ